jgi:hypothetical protein
MAVHAFNGTLTASTVSTTTLTSWQPFVAITVAASPAGTVWATTDGSTPTVGGADCEAIASGTTVVLKNLLPRPELTTVADTTGGTQPSNVPAFSAPATKVSLISSVAAVYSASLSQIPGSATVLS